MLNLAVASLCFLTSLLAYCFGIIMKMTDHRPNTSGMDLLLVAWVIASIVLVGGLGIIFPNLLGG